MAFIALHMDMGTAKQNLPNISGNIMTKGQHKNMAVLPGTKKAVSMWREEGVLQALTVRQTQVY